MNEVKDRILRVVGMTLLVIITIVILVIVTIPESETLVPLRTVAPTCEDRNGHIDWKASRGKHHRWVKIGPHTFEVIVEDGYELETVGPRKVTWNPPRPLGCKEDFSE